jgi:hypothetical protein
LDITVFRPSVIFGLGDSFLSMFAKMLKKLPVFPLGFGHARFQPVWAADVADAFVASLEDTTTFGQAYDLVGPKVYTLRELVDYTAELTNSNARIIALSEGWAYLQAGLMWLAPQPMLSPDNLRSMQVDSVAEGAGNPAPANWQPTALESIAPTYALVANPASHRCKYLLSVVPYAMHYSGVPTPTAIMSWLARRPKSCWPKVIVRSARISRFSCIPRRKRNTRWPVPSAKAATVITASPFTPPPTSHSKKIWHGVI